MSAADSSAHAGGSAVRGVFRKEGEYWTVGYAGKVFRLKHSKGLSYIASLLRQPSTEFHVLDLGEGSAGCELPELKATLWANALPIRQEELEASGLHVGGLGHAGEMLDEQAKTSYKARLLELREELAEGKELGNLDRAAQAEEEIHAITAELSRAVGLGGRNRRAASTTERARQRAKKAIKTAIERITKNDSKLGTMLARCIRTGIYCSYNPGHDCGIEWQLGTGNGILVQSAQSEQQRPNRASPPTYSEETGANTELLGPLLASPALASFAGREAELTRLHELVHYALDGLGSILLVGGGPGVGKTRLALEAANYASRCGFGFLIGRCYEREGLRPYLPFEQIIEMALREAPSMDEFRAAIADNATELAQIAPRIRRLFPEIPAPLELPPQETRRYLFQGVADTFIRVAHRVPLFLLLDDLHWADESSLALLIHLANRVARFPIVIVGTYRDSEADMTPALSRTLEELYRTGVSPIRLHGLSEDQVAMMLRGLSHRDPPASLVKVVFDETQGNPFFVEELYKHLAEERELFDASGQFRDNVRVAETDVPDRVRLVVGRRLERLGQTGKQVLSAAAVIGRSFSFKLLEAVLDNDTVDDLLTAIEQAERMGLIVSSSEGPEAPFRFAHEIVRQTLLADISLPRRQRLHLHVANAIEKADPRAAGELAAEIAHHLVKAGSASDSQRTTQYLMQAGRGALDAAAYEPALAYFESALSGVNELDSRRRAEVLYGMAIAERGLGRWGNAHLHWDEALKLFSTLNDGEAIGKISFRIAQGLIWAGHYREAEEIAVRCLCHAGEATNADRAQLLATLGISKAVEGNYSAAQKAFRQSMTVAKDLSDRSVIGAILAFRLQFNFFFLQLNEALKESHRSVLAISEDGGPWAHSQRLCWTQCALYHIGRVQQASEVGDELEPLATRIGNVAALSFWLRIQAWAEFGKRPHLLHLKEQLLQDLEANRAAGLDVFVALSHAQLSVAEFFGGDWDRALTHAQEACRRQERHVMQALSVGTLFRQMAYLADGDGARALLRQHSEKLPRAHEVNNLGSWAMLVLVVEGLLVLGERKQAAALYPLVGELIATGTVCFAFVSRFPQTVAGLAATAARQWRKAEEHFQLALAQAQEFPHLVEVAEIRRFYGAMLLERSKSGDCTKARALLTQARDSYNSIGMPRHSAIVEALLKKPDRP